MDPRHLKLSFAQPPLPASTRRQFVVRCTVFAGLANAGASSAQLLSGDEFGDAALRGAGSTFVQPLMEQWVRRYRADPYQVLETAAPNGGLGDALSNDGLDFEPVGSLGGIQRMRAGSVDFAASEMPLTTAYLERHGLMQFAWVTGGVALVTNVAGGHALRLDAATVASIFSGRITRWSDPAIRQQNPGWSPGDQSIAVQHRSDGSGTTFTLSHYLARHDPQWQERMGIDLLLKRPVGQGRKGSDDMARALKATPNSIGYVNVVQARRVGLSVALLRNAHGQYVPPERANLASAYANRRAATHAAQALPIDSPGEHSYPLVATVFGLMDHPIRNARHRRTAAFIAWTLTKGSGLADRLGYQSLPAADGQATAERLTA